MTDVKKHWDEFCRKIGIADIMVERLFNELVERYANPERHYHTLGGHISACIRKFNTARGFAENPIVVEAALWAHDACYDTRKHTNEEESADWAVDFFKKAGVALDFEELRNLVLMTKHHLPGNNRDAWIVADCDLAILGRPEKIFDEYERNIRREYEWVPEDVFRKNRANFLEDFLKRPQIYYTDEFKEKYEKLARLNVARSIELLKSTKPLL